jgi:hypothetical protein
MSWMRNGKLVGIGAALAVVLGLSSRAEAGGEDLVLMPVTAELEPHLGALDLEVPLAPKVRAWPGRLVYRYESGRLLAGLGSGPGGKGLSPEIGVKLLQAGSSANAPSLRLIGRVDVAPSGLRGGSLTLRWSRL